LNRLKSADFSSWSGSAWTSTLAYDLATITYDLNGNLTALQRYKETATLVDNLTYTIAGTSNRLTAIADAVGATAETWDAEAGSFTYDANGNQLTAPGPYSVTAATYDPRNLPLSLTRAGTATTYRYDDGGQRITKQVGAGNTEVYVQEGAVTLGVVVVNAGGTVVSSHLNLLAGDKAIGRLPSGSAIRYYHTDLLGSTRSVVQGTTVLESTDYDPWGVVLAGRSLGSGTKEGFTSKERDAETGLDYFGARHYMAALGRWSSVDPAEAADKQPEWSPFVYVGNDPVRRVDPDGRCPIPQICVAAAVIGGSALAAAATQAFTNYQQNRPLTEGVGRAALEGATAGATAVLVGLGIELAAGAVVGAVASRTAATGLGAAGTAARSATVVSEGVGAARGATRTAVGIGEHAGESIAARSAGRNFTTVERAEINRIGSQSGCHTCGTTNPGTKSGNFVPDHQPASALNASGGPQRLYPQCIGCSREQGLQIARQLSQRTP
jgi:RHS repeat-associated protein